MFEFCHCVVLSLTFCVVPSYALGQSSISMRLLSIAASDGSIDLPPEIRQKLVEERQIIAARMHEQTVEVLKKKQSIDQRKADFAEIGKQNGEEITKFLDEVLTPDQRDEVMKAFIRGDILFGDLTRFFGNADAVGFLKMERVQQIRVLAMARKFDDEYRTEMLRLRRKQINEIMESEFSDEQKAQLSKIIMRREASGVTR